MSSCNCTSLGVTNRTHIFSYSALPPESSIHQHRRSSKMRILLVYQVHLWRLRVIPIQLTNSRRTLFTSILFPCSCHTHSLPFSLAIHCSHHTTIHWLICAELQKKWQKSKSSKNPDIEDVIAFTAVYCLFIGLLHQMCPYLCCIFNALGDKCIMRAVGHMCVVYVECVCVFYPTMLRSIYAFQIPLHYLMRSYARMYYIYIHRTTECRKIIHRTK